MKYGELHFRELTALSRMKIRDVEEARFHSQMTQAEIDSMRANVDQIHELIDAAEALMVAQREAAARSA